MLKFSDPYFLCMNVDMWIICLYVVDIFGSYLQVNLRKCYSPIWMKLCTFVELWKIFDTYFFLSAKVHSEGLTLPFKCKGWILCTRWNKWQLTLATLFLRKISKIWSQNCDQRCRKPWETPKFKFNIFLQYFHTLQSRTEHFFYVPGGHIGSAILISLILTSDSVSAPPKTRYKYLISWNIQLIPPDA